MVRIVVVGGGISGLAAAHRLSRDLPAAEVVLLEASPRIGGCLRTAEVGGVVIDVGAEAMLHRRAEATTLAREVGLAEDLVHPATTQAQLWTRGRLVAMPRTMMGVPVDLSALKGVLSADGIARAALDDVLPPTVLGDDASVGELVGERLGEEVVDRLVEPLLGGVYAGHARELSVRAAVPQLVAMLGRERSLVRAAAAAMPDTGAGPLFAGLRGGVGRLPEAVAAAGSATIRTGTTVRELHRAEHAWELVARSARDPERVRADAVVLATPARATSRLLSDVALAAARKLACVDYASMAVVTLAFHARDLPAASGSGFLVPPVDGRHVKAATFSFAKWDWVREAGRGTLVLRCSLGRHREEQTLQVSDEELTNVALGDLRDALGPVGAPVDTHVQRWGGALPQYAVGHLDLVAAVRRDLAGLPGLAVCGSAYDGVGIPACIASADGAVAKVVADLGRMDP